MFSGNETDVSSRASVDRTPGFERTLIHRSIDFFNRELRAARRRAHPHRRAFRRGVRRCTGSGCHRYCCRRTGCIGDANYPAGSLLIADYEEFLAGTAELQVVFEPDAHTTASTTMALDTRPARHRHACRRREPCRGLTPGRLDEPSQSTGIPENTNTVIVAADHSGDEIFLNSSGFDHAVAAAARIRSTDRSSVDQVRAGVLRRRGPRRRAALRHVRRRHRSPVFRCSPSRFG